MGRGEGDMGWGWVFPAVTRVGACAVRVCPHAVALCDRGTGRDGDKKPTEPRGSRCPPWVTVCVGGVVRVGTPNLRGFGVFGGGAGSSLPWGWGALGEVGGVGGVASSPVAAAVGHSEDGDEDLGGQGGLVGPQWGMGGWWGGLAPGWWVLGGGCSPQTRLGVRRSLILVPG